MTVIKFDQLGADRVRQQLPIPEISQYLYLGIEIRAVSCCGNETAATATATAVIRSRGILDTRGLWLNPTQGMPEGS